MLIHMVIPVESIRAIELSDNPDFKIIDKFRSREHSVFVIDTTEEYLTYYTLIYGKDNVWKR